MGVVGPLLMVLITPKVVVLPGKTRFRSFPREGWWMFISQLILLDGGIEVRVNTFSIWIFSPRLHPSELGLKEWGNLV